MAMAGQTYDIEVNVDIRKATEELKKYSVVLYGILGILSRMGLGEEFTEIMRKIQQMIATINMLRASLILLQTASGPVGWAMAVVSVAGTILTLSEVS